MAGCVTLGMIALAGCGGSPQAATHATSTTATTAPGGTTPSTAAPPSGPAPTVFPTVYTDAPSGQPGYALVVRPGASGSGTLGGIAVFQYEDGKEAAYFSFHGRATSSAPFPLTLKGDPAATTAMAQVSSSSSITLRNCASLFSPAVSPQTGGLAEPPAPLSCTFTYKLAPGPPPTPQAAATSITATSAITSDLLSAYLAGHGWQSFYASDIFVQPGSAHLAYDPQTGLDWALATFTYSGPPTTAPDQPSAAMQDWGNTGIFYEIPSTQGSPSSSNGWAMVTEPGALPCYSTTVLPSDVLSLWGLSDASACASKG